MCGTGANLQGKQAGNESVGLSIFRRFERSHFAIRGVAYLVESLPMSMSSIGSVARTPPAESRVRVVVIADRLADREKLSAIIGASPRFLLVGSYSIANPGWVDRVEDIDIVVGYAMDDDAFDAFHDVVRQAAHIPSLVVVLNLERLSGQSGGGAIDAIAEIAELSELEVLHSLTRVSADHRVGGIPLSDARAEDRSKLDQLTNREREILILTAEGLSIKEIALRINRSYGTIASHRNALMDKVRIHDKVGLARFAIRNGLIDP